MHHTERRTSAAARALIVLAAFAGLSVACGEKAPQTDVQRDAGIYRAVLVHLTDISGVELADRWPDPNVFIEVLEPESVDLETQVALVDDFEDDPRIRFVDELDEAIDLEIPGLPVEEGTLLVALRPVEVDGAEFVLHAEYYLDADTTAAFEYRFQDEASTSGPPAMAMVGDPVAVATELVVAES